jgi:hypothetical protein
MKNKEKKIINYKKTDNPEEKKRNCKGTDA